MPQILVLMPKKTVWRPLQFYFFLNHVLHWAGRTPEEPTGRTPSIFLLVYTNIVGKLILIYFSNNLITQKEI
jgi:hypothetical protein